MYSNKIDKATALKCDQIVKFNGYYVSKEYPEKLRCIKFYDEILKDFDFVRIHKSHLINFQYVTKYLKGKGGQVEMLDGSVVDVSVNRKAEFLEKFK